MLVVKLWDVQEVEGLPSVSMDRLVEDKELKAKLGHFIVPYTYHTTRKDIVKGTLKSNSDRFG